MKPILLEIEAFGAFADKQALDFRKLEEHRLFLIHGPTGAGKTTLFDAMCYALYGETTGDRKPESMRSDHVSEEIVTLVRFIFRVGMQFYKAERSFWRKKKRKEEDKDKIEYAFEQSFGKINAKTFDWEEDPLKKVNDIATRVEQILGFSAKQFKQIVILPQGRFQELLTTTDASSKKEILIKIFNASIYKEITATLKRKAAEQRKILKEKEQGLLARLEANHQENMEQLKQLILTIEQDLQIAETQLPLWEKAYKEADNQVQEAKHLIEIFQELERNSTNLEKHLLQESLILTKAEQKNKADQAELFRNPIEQIERQKEKIVTEKKEIQTNQSIIIKLESELDEIKQKLEQLEEQEDELNEKKQVVLDLQKLQPKFQELDDLQTQLDKLTIEQTQIKQIQNETEQKRHQNSAQIEQVNLPKIEALQKILIQKSGLEKEIQELEKIASLRNEYQTTKEAFKDSKKRKEEAEISLAEYAKIYDEKRNRYEELDVRWRRSQSAILAETLEVNAPCPVCGSTHHPQKAQKTDDFVSNEQLEKAKKERSEAENQYEKIRNEFQQFSNQLEVITEKGKNIAEQLGAWKEMTETDFKQKNSETNALFQKAQSAENEIELLKQENNQKKQIIQEQDEQLRKFGEQLQAIQTQIIQCQADSKNIRNSLPPYLDSEENLLKEIEKLEDWIEKYETEREKLNTQKTEKETDLLKRDTTIKSLEKSSKKMESDLEDLEKELQRELKKKNFLSLQDLKSYLLPDLEKQTLQREIEAWKNRKIELETAYQNAHKQIKDQPKPDLEALHQFAKEKLEEWKKQQKNNSEKDSQLKHLRTQLAEIQQIEKQLVEMQNASKDLIEIADLANGDNALNQDFQTHVLSAFLDEVIDFANARLRILSQERYELRRTEEITHGNRQAGLDLKVFDSYSGKERFVQNLSGGETFFTSLALALGLADVATVKAGGIRLDSMFIDEGFGTLDSTTLDLAIKTLTHLDGEYRMVGIISHVAELKERVSSARVEVIKGQKGSKLLIHSK